MKTYQKLPVGQKFLVLIGLIFGMMSLTVSVSLVGLYWSHHLHEQTYSDRLLPTQYLGDVRALLNSDMREMLLAVQAGQGLEQKDVAHNSDYEVHLRVERVRGDFIELNQLWTDYLQLVKGTEENNLANQFSQRRDTYLNEGVRPVLVMLEQEHFDQAGTYLSTKTEPLFLQVVEAQKTLVTYQVTIAKQEVRQNKLQNMMVMGFGLVMFGLALMIFFLIINLIKNITFRIAAIETQAKALARGQLVVEKSDVATDAILYADDLAQIARAQNELAHVLLTLNTQVEIAIVAARQGNLSKRLEEGNFEGDFDDLVQGINHMLDEVLRPIEIKALILNKMAEGTLTAHVTEVFQGDHNLIRNAINQLADVAVGALQEFDGLIIAFEAGDYTQRARTENYQGDWRKIMQGINRILENINRVNAEVQRQNWIKTGVTELSIQLRGDLDVVGLCDVAITHIARYAGAQIGGFYHYEAGSKRLYLAGSYAYELRKQLSHQFALGEGLVGQAALERKMIAMTDLPDDYVHIQSATGKALPRYALVIPIVYQNELKGVIELASLNALPTEVYDFLKLSLDVLGAVLIAAEAIEKTQVLLVKTQSQAEHLQQQQEELQVSNEELQEQAQQLKQNEEQLKSQQEELQQTNEELEERTQLLETQTHDITVKNDQLENVKLNLQKQAADLALASKYKGEFLANMSHELRTPLNSMLLLARSLADNRGGNLTEKQIESASVMHQSGCDLLSIINDILDLSKIESGHASAVFTRVRLNEITEQIDGLYGHVAQDKTIDFLLSVAPNVPETLLTDRQRLGQILRNLLSNAFKFTHQGKVSLTVALATNADHFGAADLLAATDVLQFVVSDTGTGISLEQQGKIWEAFQQADGSISRQYGGTGLGLTISRELARLLGGEIHLRSELGKGSVFTLFLPIYSDSQVAFTRYDAFHEAAATLSFSSPVVTAKELDSASPASVGSIAPYITDDRNQLAEGEGAMLIVEDDPQFAQILADLCHEQGFKYLACASANEALDLLSTYTVLGVKLDMQLQDSDGWLVLNRIKEVAETQHIPVYVISSSEESQRSLQFGAVGFLQKPVSEEQLQAACQELDGVIGKTIKEILIVEDDDALREVVNNLLAGADVNIQEAATGEQALAIIAATALDLIVLDLGLPDMNGAEVLARARQLSSAKLPPVLVFTGRELSRQEYEQLQKYAINVIIKGVRSQERLVNEAALFLHRKVSEMPERTRKMLVSIRDREALFIDKQVLLVDDDIRNVFSLSGILEERGITVVTAKNGQEALALLDANPSLDMVLTDIMMPIMDGYELIKKIRSQRRFAQLPILALTAKAMREDRDRCIEAGASDYITKPIDIDRLLSLMRVWMYR